MKQIIKKSLAAATLLLCAAMLVSTLCACTQTAAKAEPQNNAAEPTEVQKTDAAKTDAPSDNAAGAPVEGIENAMLASQSSDAYAYVSPQGVLYTWGYNGGVGLGTGEMYDAYTPVEIARDVRWAGFAS